MIPGVVVTDLDALRSWLNDSDGHVLMCHAWSEGQACCLDYLVDVVEADEPDQN